MAARRNSAPRPEVTPVEESPVVLTSDVKEEAAPVAEGYTVVIGPSGIPSTVPDGIVAALVDSGYKVK
ncbi:hypothetical protein [Paenarthrobacter sp. NPDC018779]|uniref:hypothetical protein n=1 Tax=Paenarthrobacter sp. NPDC018779 TaxID=3364375 RepID=UPI0037CB0BD8